MRTKYNRHRFSCKHGPRGVGSVCTRTDLTGLLHSPYSACRQLCSMGQPVLALCVDAPDTDSRAVADANGMCLCQASANEMLFMSMADDGDCGNFGQVKVRRCQHSTAAPQQLAQLVTRQALSYTSLHAQLIRYHCCAFVSPVHCSCCGTCSS